MTIEEELQLSYYQEVASINAEHGISLVQDIRNKKFFVKKSLRIYNRDVYTYLWAHPIPNTPRIYFLAEHAGSLTVIEEYIPGETLEEILDEGPLSEERTIAITISLCQIIEAFHSREPAIINRDIKPSNIKISPDGVVKLIDLNAAKISNNNATRDTMLIGTQGYAAPEQYGFGASSVQTDIYAIGVLMNVMLTGELPGVRIAAGKLKRIIDRCVELTPRRRFQNVQTLREALLSLQGKHSLPPDKSAWKTYLPPGFRSSNPLLWLLSTAAYIFTLSITLNITVENGTFAEIWVNRIFCTIAVISIILFSGDYLNIRETFPFTKSKNKTVRWIAVTAIDLLILMACVFLCTVIENLFFK